MKTDVWATAVCLALWAAVPASRVEGQVIAATVRGTVIDQHGGVLPGATVMARQVETNVAKSGVTGASGTYYLPGLPAGTYEIEARLSGFAPLKRRVELAVGADVTLEFSLSLGGVETEITVTGESPPVDTTRTVVGKTIGMTQIDALPTVNRDFTSLALLAPGVTTGVGGNGASLAVNAQRGYQNGIFVDGVSNLWQYYGRQASTFSQDWIQEFQVMTNSFSAEFGTASGGILNVITRSGSNQFGGRAYGYLRRNTFDSPPFAGSFKDNDIENPVFLTEDEVPDYTQRRWGGYFGGPIVKDKVFFFTGYEDLNRGSNNTLAITDYWRALGFDAVVPIRNTDHPFMIKGDYNINAGHRLSVRYDRTINKNINIGGVYSPTEGRHSFGGPVWNIVANLTSTLSNTSFNEFRASYMSNMPPLICNRSGVGGMDSLALGPPGTFALVQYPHLAIGCPVFSGTEGEQNLVFLEHYTLVRGRHQFKIGGQAQQNTLNDNLSSYHDGYWRFAQDLLFDASNPASYPFVFAGNVGLGAFRIPMWSFNLFAQDTWQVRDNLTLNLGVRYDVDRSVMAGNQFVDGKNAEIVAKYGGTPPLEKTDADYNNVAPRLGFVWTPTTDKRTTVRGAVGLFYDQNHGNFNAIYIVNTLLSGGLTLVNCNSPATNPYWSPANQAAGRATCREWLARTFPLFPDLSTAPATTQGLDTLAPNLQVPYTTQVSAGVAHAFASRLAVSADVIYSQGSGLEYIDISHALLPNGDVEDLDPRFTYVSQLQNVGFTHYAALQAKAEYRRPVFELSASYTLSKATSNLVSGSIFASAPTNPFDLNQDLGPDATDIRHNVAVTGTYLFPLDFQFAAIAVYRSARPWNAYTTLNPTGAYYPPRIEPKNSRRGASLSTVDLRLGKMFRLGHRVRINVFWEAFNALNTLNYAAYDALRESRTFGLPVAAADMRRQQLGLRIDF